jgi:hypothetical protein
MPGCAQSVQSFKWLHRARGLQTQQLRGEDIGLLLLESRGFVGPPAPAVGVGRIVILLQAALFH